LSLVGLEEPPMALVLVLVLVLVVAATRILDVLLVLE